MLNQTQFLDRCRARHGDRYDYSKAVFKTTTKPVEIVCHEHGSFQQRPKEHFRGRGCPTCAKENASRNRVHSLERVLADFREAHGDRYDYSRVVYKGNFKKVVIICNKHGRFEQVPASHKQGIGCPQCGIEENAVKRASTRDEFIVDAKKAHGDRYDYSQVVYKNNHTPVTIICSEHGAFEQKPYQHKAGGGCRACGYERSGLDRRSSVASVVARFREVHGDKYDYSRVEYRDYHTPVTIVCPEHDAFEQRPADHMVGKGCPECVVQRSKGELEMSEFIQSLGFETTHSELNGMARWSYDVVVESKKVAFEFNGVYWHSYPRPLGKRGRHYYKRKHAENHGYRMVTIWEDDWVNRRAKMEALIRRTLLGAKQNIGARKCRLIKVDHSGASAFHDEHHLQGRGPAQANIHYMLRDGDKRPVAVATFDRKGTLHRYTVRDGWGVTGGLARLIKVFLKQHLVEQIVTYCDRDHFGGGLYEAVGFKRVSGTLQMSYVVGSRRVRRERYMKHKLPEVFGRDIDMGKREIDICAENGVYACWNSGVDKLVLDLTSP